MPQTKPMTDKRLAYLKARHTVRVWSPLAIDGVLGELTAEIDRLRTEMELPCIVCVAHGLTN